MNKNLWQDFQLKHLVDEEGNVSDRAQQNICLAEAEKALERTLGCTLIYRGKAFVLTNLELYYGSAGDRAHDWWRTQFGNGRGISKEHSGYQEMAGPRLYTKTKGRSTRNRMDLVIGPAGVAISFLVRNVMNDKGELLADPLRGGPSKLIQSEGLDLRDEDIGQLVKLLDTHKKFVKNSECITKSRRYIGGLGFVGFPEAFPDKLWNVRISSEATQ